MFLTADELGDLTDRKRWSAQIAWLREKRWKHATTADGRPVVSRTEAQQQQAAERAAPAARCCSVYIAISAGVPGVCKIGVSVRVAARIKTIDASSPVPVSLFFSREFPNERRAYACESALHREFHAHRRPGTEWFREIDVAAVRAAVERAR